MVGDHTDMTLNLTQDQQEAFDKFVGFLLSNEEEFHLFGSAGCGKTFLTRHFVSEGIKQYESSCKVLGMTPEPYIVDITATTNKAAEILQSVGFYNATTIFKLFNVRVVEDFKTGASYLKEDRSPILEKHLIFVDECSMLPQKMKKIILGNTYNCKIVYIGDNYQLAPVKEKPNWSETPSNTTAILTTPVRNKSSQALIDLCTQLRTTVDTQEFKDIQLTPGVIEKLEDEDLKTWLKTTDFSKNRVLSYTNERAIEYIQWIEKFRHNSPEFLRKNQLYINNSFFNKKDNSYTYYPEEGLFISSIWSDRPNKVIEGYRSDLYEIEGIWANVVSAHNRNKGNKAFIANNPLDLKNKIKLAAKRKDWIAYYALQSEIMDLRLPFASTIHKAQGSTYDEVVVDLESFNACKSYSVASRLLYVAVSRAKNKVYFYGDMPKRFGNLI